MKILCVDGGGIFGYIPAKLLSFASDKTLPEFLAYGGTSVGSLLTASYSMGKSTQEVFSEFEKMADVIFQKSIWRRFNPLAVKFPAKNIEPILQQWFGKAQLRNLKKYNVIPTYDFKKGKPKIFDNVCPSNKDQYEEVWKVCRKSSAAPTFFPPCDGFVDGGIIANNPTMVTAWALHNKLGIPFEEMEIFSIGTGFKKEDEHERKMPRTNAGWLSPMLDILTEGNEQIFHFGASQVNFKKYVRFNPVPLKDGWSMDDKSLLSQLEELCYIYRDEFLTALRLFNDDTSTSH